MLSVVEGLGIQRTVLSKFMGYAEAVAERSSRLPIGRRTAGITGKLLAHHGLSLRG